MMIIVFEAYQHFKKFYKHAQITRCNERKKASIKKSHIIIIIIIISGIYQAHFHQTRALYKY